MKSPSTHASRGGNTRCFALCRSSLQKKPRNAAVSRMSASLADFQAKSNTGKFYCYQRATKRALSHSYVLCKTSHIKDSHILKHHLYYYLIIPKFWTHKKIRAMLYFVCNVFPLMGVNVASPAFPLFPTNRLKKADFLLWSSTRV